VAPGSSKGVAGEIQLPRTQVEIAWFVVGPPNTVKIGNVPLGPA